VLIDQWHALSFIQSKKTHSQGAVCEVSNNAASDKIEAALFLGQAEESGSAKRSITPR
jgi:hypothetical protein